LNIYKIKFILGTLETDMGAGWVFDQKHYERLNAARAVAVSQILREVKSRLELQSALDVGCGPGYFTNWLGAEGLEVLGVDGREETVTEARCRFPEKNFLCRDGQGHALVDLGTFDLVFCLGLLYHLENPFLALRQLRTMTRKLLLAESVIYPGEEPVMALMEEASSEDQGLRHVAFYPTEACFVKMLYRSGFTYVYRVAPLPEHPEYHQAPGWRRNRTMLAASCEELQTALLAPIAEPGTKILPWHPASGVQGSPVLNKLRRFAHRPLPMKLEHFHK
jgi:SAM-dependent methyltransferase